MSSGEKRLITLDVDGTVIKGSLAGLALAHCIERGWTDLAARDPGHLSREEVRHLVATMAGKSLRDFRALIDMVAATAPELCHPWAQERLAYHQKKEDIVLFLSHSPSFLVEPLAKGIGGISLAAGSNLHVQDGVFTGTGVTLDKLTQLDRWIKENRLAPTVLFAATDSIVDAGMMRRARYGAVIDPDPELQELAIVSSWEVITTQGWTPTDGIPVYDRMPSQYAGY